LHGFSTSPQFKTNYHFIINITALVKLQTIFGTTLMITTTTQTVSHGYLHKKTN